MRSLVEEDENDRRGRWKAQRAVLATGIDTVRVRPVHSAAHRTPSTELALATFIHNALGCELLRWRHTFLSRPLCAWRTWMTTQVKVSSKYQIAVPASVRRELSIKAGDYLLVEIEDGAIILVPKPIDPIEELRGLGREVWNGVDAQDYVDRERDGW